MVQKINIDQLYETLAKGRILIDVRTPAEFEQGHIVGAVNLPLFTNEERVVVGTIYKKTSPESALLKGLDLVGKKLSFFIKKAKKIAPERRLVVHCWRGGKRSGSLAWLFDLAGFDVVTLEGGYKNYRKLVHETIADPTLNLKIVGGRTGTGKTEILHQLQAQGEQIIDLEALANHKGSAFGALGELPQPSTEHFENLLFEHLRKLDTAKTIWLENESRGIGTVFLPEPFWQKIKTSPLYNIEIPFALRVQRLVNDYAQYPEADLVTVFNRLQKKLGNVEMQRAIDAVKSKDFTLAAEIALYYYDKTYQFSLENNPSPSIHRLVFDHANMASIAKNITLL